MSRNIKKITNIFKNKSIIASFAIFFIITLLALSYNIISINNTRKECYNLLDNVTKEACSKIESNFKNDRAALKMLSRIIDQSDDLTSNEVNKQITAYDINNYTLNIAVLTKNNIIIQPNNKKNSAKGIIDFDTEISLGEHIYKSESSMISQNKNVLRSYIPIKDKGILFTELDPDVIADLWAPQIYNGSASFCIIDKDTGDIIINSKKYKDIDKIMNIEANLKNGESGFEEINSEIIVSYKPMDFENWEIVFIVNADNVFSSAIKMQKIMYGLITIGAAIFIVYLYLIFKLNQASISQAEEEANTDVLTGLKNRNLYESFCSKLCSIEGLYCIYIDANGLHEINNSQGHLAGDQMLRYIADTLKIYFGKEYIYRIGGDEFVVLIRNKTEKEIEKSIYTAEKAINKNEYHISYGYSVGNSSMTIKMLIKDAEQKMYAMKEEYYTEIGKKIRNNNPDKNGLL